MILPSTILARVTAAADNPYRETGSAKDFLDAQGIITVSPSLFVLPATRKVLKTSSTVGLVSIHVREEIVLLTGIAGAQAIGTGSEDADALSNWEKWLIDLIVGWQPEGVVTPFVFTGGGMAGLDAKNSTLFWGSTFAAEFYIRKGTSA